VFVWVHVGGGYMYVGILDEHNVQAAIEEPCLQKNKKQCNSWTHGDACIVPENACPGLS
jgi:hypothetical protein